ncbi:MAG: hypothetical protein CVV64_18770 [Candidatus Wallbacteria bacterium HGW-Wallbacteria-1]|jgi:tetratricopeptide (TPR) repeat protein|uniref:J domain-containing protein n=1 Tax=Candidatus Wallbacteria bacterium HGW-Wallbacteria-1 TaxID=2013854 RepID=A0A2N1PJD0_9BACT|nr:MAG: hypothetical protein CVV64_18770 [Candidatus Wallbacteria bacterium HGW-Wallbacteria-1]
MRSLYDILKVLPTASDEAIKTAFHVLAGDLLDKAEANIKLTAKEIKTLRELKGAFTTLSDPEKRRLYDKRTGIATRKGDSGIPHGHPTNSWDNNGTIKSDESADTQIKGITPENNSDIPTEEIGLGNDPLYQEAIEVFLAGDLITALKLFREVEKKYPDQPGPTEMRALCARISGDQEKAMELYQRLTRNFPDRIDNTIFLAEIYLEEEMQDQALDLLENLATICEAILAIMHADYLQQRAASETSETEDDTDDPDNPDNSDNSDNSNDSGIRNNPYPSADSKGSEGSEGSEGSAGNDGAAEYPVTGVNSGDGNLMNDDITVDDGNLMNDDITLDDEDPSDSSSDEDKSEDFDNQDGETITFDLSDLQRYSAIPLYDLLRVLGLAYHLLGDTDAAAECLVEALELAGDVQERISILTSLMEIYHDAGWIHGVLGAAAELLELEPDNPTPCYGVAVTLFSHNILGPALTWVNNAMKLDPEMEGGDDLKEAIQQEIAALPEPGKTLEEKIFTSEAQSLRRGTVVWFDPVEGAGMAMDGKGRKIFIHYLSIMADSAVPTSGKTVEFAVTRHEGQEVAVGLRVMSVSSHSPDDTVIGVVQSVDLARGFSIVKAGTREILVLHSKLHSGSAGLLRSGMKVKCSFVTTSSLADKPLLMATSIIPHEG